MTEGNKGSLERKLGREGRNVEVFSGFFFSKGGHGEVAKECRSFRQEKKNIREV